MTYTQPASILGQFSASQQAVLLGREDKIGRLFAAGTQSNVVNSGTRKCPLYYPLPDGAPVAGDSAGIMSAWMASATGFTGLNRTGYAVPVKIVSDGDPAPSFTQRTPNMFLTGYMAQQNIRITAGWDYPYAGQDEGVEFLHLDANGEPDTLLSVHGFQRVNASSVTYNNAGIIQVGDAMGVNPYLYRDASGHYYDVHPQPGFTPSGDWKYAPGAAGSRIPYAPTKIRAGEVALGRIDHALMLIVDLNMVRAGFSYPAAWTDGAGTTANRFREGQMVRLPASLDIDGYAASHPRLTRLGKIMMRAGQEHGFVIGDRTSVGTITLSSDSADELGFDPWPILDGAAGGANPLIDFPWSQAKVLAVDYDPAAEPGATFSPRSTGTNPDPDTGGTPVATLSDLYDGRAVVTVDASNGKLPTAVDVSTATGLPTVATLGLGEVDNTADVDKPISTATSAALAGKMPIGFAGLPTGTGIRVYRDGADWELGGVVITARPTARTDVWVEFLSAVNVAAPAWALAGVDTMLMPAA